MLTKVRAWRWTEIQLLIVPSLISLLGLAMVLVVPLGAFALTWRDLWTSIVFIALLFAVNIWLTISRPNADQVIFPTVAMLTALGLTMSQRLQPSLSSANQAQNYLANKQVIWIGLGLFVLLLVLSPLFQNLSWMRRYKYTWAVLGILLLVATLVAGRGPADAPDVKIYFDFGFFQFQPSELLKVILVVFLAAYLYDKRDLLVNKKFRLGPLPVPPIPYLAPLLLILALTIVTVIIQRDLGAALLFFGIFITMLYVASGQGWYVIAAVVMFAGAAAVLYESNQFGHIRDRVAVWLDPWPFANTSGYQIVQSLYALANGGSFGSGIGQGQPYNIPVVQSDFIFAAIGEEMGLAGTLAVIALYLILVYRGFHIALRAGRGFSQLLAIGLTTIFGLQAIIIIAGSIKLIPLTGITLPFISYGGSSLLVNFLIVGLLLRISAAKPGEF